MKRPYDRALIHLIEISEQWDRWLHQFRKLLEPPWDDTHLKISHGFKEIKYSLLRNGGDDVTITTAEAQFVDRREICLPDEYPMTVLGRPVVWSKVKDLISEAEQNASHHSHSSHRSQTAPIDSEGQRIKDLESELRFSNTMIARLTDEKTMALIRAEKAETEYAQWKQWFLDVVDEWDPTPEQLEDLLADLAIPLRICVWCRESGISTGAWLHAASEMSTTLDEGLGGFLCKDCEEEARSAQ